MSLTHNLGVGGELQVKYNYGFNAALKLCSTLYCKDIFSALGNAVANQHANVITKNIKPPAFWKRQCKDSSPGRYL